MNADIRSRLRNLNMEISGLIRNSAAAHREVRLTNLCKHRDALMGKLTSVIRPRAVQKASSASVEIWHLLPKANNGMSA